MKINLYKVDARNKVILPNKVTALNKATAYLKTNYQVNSRIFNSFLTSLENFHCAYTTFHRP